MKRWLVLLPFLCGILAYAPAPWSELVWDDAVLIDYQITEFRSVRDAFVPPAGVTRWTYAYYRPVVVLTHMAERRIFGLGVAGGPHVVNLAVHLAVTLFVWLLARRLLQGSPRAAEGAVVAATLFAVHPIHAESVSWVAGRSDLIATAFLLPALRLALEWRDRRSVAALALSPLLFLAAVLAKESGILALALVPWLLWLAPRVGGERGPAGRPAVTWGALAAGYGIATLVYLWLRYLADIPPAVSKELDWMTRAIQVVASVAWYLGKLFVPWPQSALVSLNALPGLPLAMALVVAALAASLWAAWSWRRRGQSLALLACGWFWVTISLPVWIAAFAMNNTPLAERYLYLPSVALALGAGLAWCAAERWRKPMAAAFAVIAVVYAGSTLERAMVWRNNLALWTDTVRKSPEVGLAWTNLGFAQLRRGDEDSAMGSFVNALRDPDYEPKWVARSHNGLGLVLIKRGELDVAEEHLRTAIDLAPDFSEPYLQMGLVFRKRAEQFDREGSAAARDTAVDRAIFYFSTAIRRRNNYFAARLTLADCLAADGRWLEREGRMERAVRRYEAARDELGRIRKLMAELVPVARHAEAMRTLEQETGVNLAGIEGEVAATMKRLRLAPGAA